MKTLGWDGFWCNIFKVHAQRVVHDSNSYEIYMFIW